jgi:hypothetical protein
MIVIVLLHRCAWQEFLVPSERENISTTRQPVRHSLQDISSKLVSEACISEPDEAVCFLKRTLRKKPMLLIKWRGTSMKT